MKKLNLLFLSFLFLLSLSNCTNDDNNDTEQSNTSIEPSKLIGTWYSDKQNPDQMILNFDSSNYATFTLLKAGNNGEDIHETGTWELSGNRLYITWDDADPGLFYWNSEILELTSTTLKWKELIDSEYYTFIFHR